MMTTIPRFTGLVLTSLAVAAGATITAAAAVAFTATFKSLDAGSANFAGRKVAALVISTDDSLRMSGEEALARELTARGIQGVAAYRIAPREELQRAETARAWFERANIEGIVAIRPVSAETRQTYTPATWVTTNY